MSGKRWNHAAIILLVLALPLIFQSAYSRHILVSAGIFASSGHRTLDQAALEAVKRAPFDPGRQGATPVSSTGDVVVRFHLN